jgi:hypothetical protein
VGRKIVGQGKWVRRRLLVIAFIVGMAICAAGCETTYLETSGKMTNQRSSQQSQNGQSHNNREDVAPAAGAALNK